MNFSVCYLYQIQSGSQVRKEHRDSALTAWLEGDCISTGRDRGGRAATAEGEDSNEGEDGPPSKALVYDHVHDLVSRNEAGLSSEAEVGQLDRPSECTQERVGTLGAALQAQIPNDQDRFSADRPRPQHECGQ